MKIYRIRNKRTGEYFQDVDGRAVWVHEEHCWLTLATYMYLKNFPQWHTQWEIVEFTLVEVLCN